MKTNKIRLDWRMMPIILKHFQLFNERCADGRGQQVWDLYHEYVNGVAKHDWKRSCTPTTISGVIHGKKYSQLITPSDVSCTCPSFKYSAEGQETCKHIAVLLLLLWQHELYWINK